MDMEQWLAIRRRVLREGVSKRQILYLSSANETTPDRCLSSLTTGTYALDAPGWHFAPIEAIRNLLRRWHLVIRIDDIEIVDTHAKPFTLDCAWSLSATGIHISDRILHQRTDSRRTALYNISLFHRRIGLSPGNGCCMAKVVLGTPSDVQAGGVLVDGERTRTLA